MAKKEVMLTVREVAERLGAGQSSIRIWCAKSELKGARHEQTPMGSYWLIPESALDGFIKRSVGRPPKSEARGRSAAEPGKTSRKRKKS